MRTRRIGRSCKYNRMAVASAYPTGWLKPSRCRAVTRVRGCVGPALLPVQRDSQSTWCADGVHQWSWRLPQPIAVGQGHRCTFWNIQTAFGWTNLSILRLAPSCSGVCTAGTPLHGAPSTWRRRGVCSKRTPLRAGTSLNLLRSMHPQQVVTWRNLQAVFQTAAFFRITKAALKDFAQRAGLAGSTSHGPL